MGAGGYPCYSEGLLKMELSNCSEGVGGHPPQPDRRRVWEGDDRIFVKG